VLNRLNISHINSTFSFRAGKLLGQPEICSEERVPRSIESEHREAGRWLRIQVVVSSVVWLYERRYCRHDAATLCVWELVHEFPVKR